MATACFCLCSDFQNAFYAKYRRVTQRFSSRLSRVCLLDTSYEPGQSGTSARLSGTPAEPRWSGPHKRDCKNTCIKSVCEAKSRLDQAHANRPYKNVHINKE